MVKGGGSNDAHVLERILFPIHPIKFMRPPVQTVAVEVRNSEVCFSLSRNISHSLGATKAVARVNI